MNAFNAGLQGLMDKYSHRAEEIASLANTMDWSQGSSTLQDFNYQLMQMGINVAEGSAEWQLLISAMSKLNMSVVHSNVEKLRTTLADIQEIASGITIGDIITDEQYDSLIRYKAELADMFVMTTKGYAYIGTGSLAQHSYDVAINSLEETKQRNQKAKDTSSQLNNLYSGNKNLLSKLTGGVESDENLTANAQSLLDSIDTANLGYNEDFVQTLIDTIGNGSATSEQKTNARNELKALFGEAMILMNNDEAVISSALVSS